MSTEPKPESPAELAVEAKRVMIHGRDCERGGLMAPEAWRIAARHIDRLAAIATLQASDAPQDVEPVPRESDQQLMRFYSVETIPALIDAQERHIVKLQAKLPPLRDEFPRNPRSA